MPKKTSTELADAIEAFAAGYEAECKRVGESDELGRAVKAVLRLANPKTMPQAALETADLLDTMVLREPLRGLARGVARAWRRMQTDA